MTPFAVTFDYPSSFARNAAEVVVRAVEAGAPHQVVYRGFWFSRSILRRAPGRSGSQGRPSGVLMLQ